MLPSFALVFFYLSLCVVLFMTASHDCDFVVVFIHLFISVFHLANSHLPSLKHDVTRSALYRVVIHIFNMLSHKSFMYIAAAPSPSFGNE